MRKIKQQDVNIVKKPEKNILQNIILYRWDPREYGGVEMLHVPSDHIWRPDIVVRHMSNKLFTFHLLTVLN